MSGAAGEHARRAIRAGSKSFYAASRLFGPRTRESAFLLYAWCRHCDDEIDGQDLGHGRVVGQQPAGARLERLERLTRRALGQAPLDGPVWLGLRRVVNRHRVPHELPLALLEGFRMDVEGRTYRSLDDSLRYCYHVAGVVGVMMARVMGVEDEETLDRAADLGLAFQMTNIARDVVDDALLGRVYLPLDWLAAEGLEPEAIAWPDQRPAVARVVGRYLGEAERYYESSLAGIARLGARDAWAIAAARRIYRAIGERVLTEGPRAWDRRTVVSARRKLWLLVAGAGDALTRQSDVPPRESLWTRPRHDSA